MSFAFMRLYTGDYRRDTQHLSMLEHSAYLLLLIHCWDQKGPVPLDERRIFAICNARSNEEMGAVRNILAEFFVRMEDGWYNKRMSEEIAASQHYSEVSSEGGKRSGLIRKARSEARRLSRIEGPFNPPSRPLEGPSVSPSPSPSLSPESKSQNLLSETSVSDPYPQCPILKIQVLYQEILPMLPQVRVKNAAREANIRARWKQVFAEDYASTVDEGLQTFRDYFERVAKSKFLTGQGFPQPGRKPFVADLTWLMNATNFAKVIERGYA